MTPQVLNPANGLPLGGGVYLEARPLPPPDEIEQVIADIRDDRDLRIDRGVVRITSRRGYRELNRRLREALKSLQPASFRVALFSGDVSVLGGQPVAIPVDPPIDYDFYPSHPHLNLGSLTRNGWFPETICYTDNPDGLGSGSERIYRAWLLIVVWLFRHQLWEKTGTWIGQQTKPLPSEHFIYRLSPNGGCRCGSGKPYGLCHLTEHLMEHHRCSEGRAMYEAACLANSWETRVLRPKQTLMRRIRGQLV